MWPAGPPTRPAWLMSPAGSPGPAAGSAPTPADLQQLWDPIPAGRVGDGGDGADPQRLGAAGGLVPPPRRDGDHGPAGAVRGPAGLLLQARQVRPAGFPDAGPAAAAAPRGAAPGRGPGPRRPAAPGRKLRGSLVKRRSVIVARLDSYLELLGPHWHAAFGGDLALLHAAAVPGRRLRRPARRPPARQGPADPVHLALLPRRLGRRARHPDPGRRGRDPAAMGHRAQLPRPGRGHRRRGPPGPGALQPRSATWTPRSPRCCASSTPPAS